MAEDDGGREDTALVVEADVTGDIDRSFALPTGTVTFLLSDVEGSTRRWEAAPEAMAMAIPRHYELMDEAISRHHGVRPVEQGEGDSVVAAFSRPSDAVAAAVAAQRLLASEQWPQGGELRVRIAVHTGEAQLRDAGNYVGHTLNRCARIRATGFGGQILMSAATAALVGDHLPLGSSLVDLGAHRLKDLGKPEQIFHVVLDDLPSTFPPLRSLDIFRHNLPTQLTPFIGRTQDLAHVRQHLVGERLVTLTGSAGVGKTRLALATAAELVEHFPGGVWLVELAAVSDPDGVCRAALAAVGAQPMHGMVAAHQLADELGDAPSLLILDNCEHVIEPCADLVAAVLVANPAVSVLATSREPLGVPGEVTSRVPSMSCPDPQRSGLVAALSQFDAVSLFIDRAHRARPSFEVTEANAPSVAQICHRLDGIPLAIELAAARCRQMPVERIAAELDDRFRLLTGGARTVMARQQTLLASIEWSHERLDEREQVAFRRLGAFVGAFPLAAAEAAVASRGDVDRAEVFDVLCRLVDKSLLIASEDGADPYYRMLETLQRFALDRAKAAGELTGLRDAVGAWWIGWFERNGPAADRVRVELVRYHDGIRAALQWSSNDPETGLRLLALISHPWGLIGRQADAGPTAEDLLTDANATLHPELWLSAAWHSSWAVFLLGGPAAYDALIDRLETVALAHGDRDALAIVDYARDAGGDGWRAAAELALRVGDHLLWASALVNGARAAAESDSAEDIEFIERLLASGANGEDWDGSIVQTMVRSCLANATGDLVAALHDAGSVVLQSPFPYHPARELGFATLLSQNEVALRRAVHAIEDYARGAPGVHWLDTAHHRLELLTGVPSSVDRDIINDTAEWSIISWGTLWLIGREAIDAGAAERTVVASRRMLATPRPLRVAVVAALEGAAAGSEDSWHQALRLATEHGFRLVAVDALEGLAACAAGAESWAEALRLLGAAERLRDETGYRWRFGFEQRSVDAVRQSASVALGAAAEAAFAAGRSIEWREAASYAARAPGERKRPSHGWASLTPTEQQVVALIAEGLSNPQIAERLLMSRATVKTHLVHVFDKLGITSRAELAAEMVRRQA